MMNLNWLSSTGLGPSWHFRVFCG